MTMIKEAKQALTDHRAERKLLRSSLSKEERMARKNMLHEKPPWAFSPSGKWRPGLWSGNLDRSKPVHHGEEPQSIAFIGNEQPQWAALSQNLSA